MTKNILITILAILFILSSIFIIYNISNSNNCYRPSFSIIGDVKNTFKLDSYGNLERVNINYKNQKLEVIRLKELIDKVKPLTDEFSILFSARDGLGALIPGNNLDRCYIHFSEQNGWEAININHPVSSNIKYIDNIKIVSGKKDINNCFSIITPDENLVQNTVGQFLAGEYYHYPHFEGTSTLEKDGINYKDSIYTVKKVLKVEDMVDENIGFNSYVIGDKGSTELYRDGVFVLEDNSISYLDPERKITVENCKGLVINPPSKRNSDTYYDTLHYLEKGKRVLIILLDGFGYHQYHYAVDNGFAPFLAGYKKAKKAISVYRPVTNAGLAATLTGQGPEKNGVYSREQKDLKTVDIFEKVSNSGGRNLYIEGNIKILNTSIEPVLNPDYNGNGSTDDEVFAAARGKLDKGYNLIYVHFHGIDDYGHDYGDLDEKTMQKIKETDSYLKKLIENWQGKVIITADHGMHSTDGGGDHGFVRYEDLIIPYILAEGGKTGE